MKRIWPVRLHLLAAIVAAAAAMGVIAPPASAASQANAAAAAGVIPRSMNVTSPCQDVIFVGARGSGESPTENRALGSRVSGFLDDYAAKVSNRRVGYYAVNYVAKDVAFILTSPSTYFSGLDQGITDAMAFVKPRLSRCPQEHYVFAGYSQGAMVMHRLMFQLGAIPHSYPRVDGYLIIADGDRRHAQGGREYGSSTSLPIDYGVSWAYPGVAGGTFKPIAASVPTALATRYHSVCDAGDVVCDYGVASLNAATLATGVYRHTHRYGPSTASALAATAEVAAQTMRRAPVSAMRIVTSTLPLATVATPYLATLSASAGAAPYTWRTVSGGALPPGLALSSSGLITGTPTAAGAWTARFRATDANGQWIQKDLTLTVSVSGTTGPSITLASNFLSPYLSRCAGGDYFRLRASGGGFSPNESLTLAFANTTNSGVSDSAGGYALSGIVPSETLAGVYVVTVSGAGGEVASTQVTISKILCRTTSAISVPYMNMLSGAAWTPGPMTVTASDGAQLDTTTVSQGGYFETGYFNTCDTIGVVLRVYMTFSDGSRSSVDIHCS